MWAVTVAGDPVPKPDPKCFGRGGMHRLSVPEKAAGYKPWRERCVAAGVRLLEKAGAPLTGPVSVDVTFTITPPKTMPKGRAWPAVRVGDVDKLCRLLLDALTESGLWRDDSQVVQLTATKAYPTSPAHDALPEPGALIRVWRTPDADLS